MRSLGQILNSVRGGEPLGDPTDPEYILRHLMDLPPTQRVSETRLDLANKATAFPEGSLGRSQFDAEVERLDRRLKLCVQRDELQGTRPEGCWCLGLGGKAPRYTAEGEMLYSFVCDCAEGVREGARRDAIRQKMRADADARRTARLFGAAKVPTRFQGCTFETFPVSDATRDVVARLRYWASGPEDREDDNAWAKWGKGRKRSLLLHGPFGTGKTGLAVAILRETIRIDDEGALFFTVPTLLDHIRTTYAPGSNVDEHEVVDAVKSTPFLVLDDLGAERVTDWVAEKLFTVINHRHDEDLPTVFTSNLDVAELGAHIGERTTWRLIEMCEVVKIDGPNLRDRR